MDGLQRYLNGLNNLFQIIREKITAADLTYLIPFLIATGIIIKLIGDKVEKKKTKIKYTAFKEKKGLYKDIVQYLLANKRFREVATNIAEKLSLFNSYNLEVNLEYATVGSGVLILLTIISIVVFLPSSVTVWYMTVFSVFLALMFVVVVFYTFTIFARRHFNNQLPNTFKIINSRYVTCGDIAEALYISLDDFEKSVRREIEKILDALRKNDMTEINDTFRMIEKSYKNEYVTLLLNLIKQAYYKGGKGAIKSQFENTTEEILTDIENQKDLTNAAWTYIVLSLILPGSLYFLERFNTLALKEKAVEFYASPYGLGVKVAFLIGMLLYIAVMLFLERTT